MCVCYPIIFSKTAIKMIDLIKKRPDITTKELANSLKISYERVEYNLAEMQKSGVINREGSKKGF
ncbi:winged helix-turn-helix domain-containing protein [Belliella filtrata]|nr:winged helix-turn-helix transcriptional regulator [Belliella filtrata]